MGAVAVRVLGNAVTQKTLFIDHLASGQVRVLGNAAIDLGDPDPEPGHTEGYRCKGIDRRDGMIERPSYGTVRRDVGDIGVVGKAFQHTGGNAVGAGFQPTQIPFQYAAPGGYPVASGRVRNPVVLHDDVDDGAGRLTSRSSATLGCRANAMPVPSMNRLTARAAGI